MNRQFKGTPGEWEVYEQKHKLCTFRGIQAKNGRVVVGSHEYDKHWVDGETETISGPAIRPDDARAIAAVPDMLGALQSALYDMEEVHADELTNAHYGDDPDGCLYCKTIDEMRAALNKALGEEESDA